MVKKRTLDDQILNACAGKIKGGVMKLRECQLTIVVFGEQE